MTNLEHALSYALKKWPVFPVHTPGNDGTCSCPNSVCPSPGKHPRTPQGLKDATMDPVTISAWWSEWPDASIGIATGIKSGLVVLDIDPYHEGTKSLLALQERHGELPSTPVTHTGGGGQHYFFGHPGQGVRVMNRTGLDGLPGIDLRGDGGFVVAAPSCHVSGTAYRWDDTLGPDSPLAQFPESLLGLVVRQEARVQQPTGSDYFQEGERNDRLFSVAGSLHRQGLNAKSLREALLVINRDQCSTPLEDAEVEKIATSITRYPQDAATTYKKKNGGGIELEDSATTSLSKRGGGKVAPQAIGDLIEQLEREGELQTSWLWEGFIPTGGLVMLAGSPKAGKSTMAAHLAVAVSQGKPFLGLPTKKSKVLWLGLEERPQDVVRRFSDLGGMTEILVQPGPLRISLSVRQELGAVIAKEAVGLVIVDTLSKLWMVNDENDASLVEKGIDPLLQLARETGAAVLILHHTRKSPAENGADIRGSSALFSSVDTAIVYRKQQENTRLLESYSRYAETPSKLVVELSNGAFRARGELSEVQAKEHDEKAMAALSREPQSISTLALKVTVPESSARRMFQDLAKKYPLQVASDGSGRKGDPKTFRLTGREIVLTGPDSVEPAISLNGVAHAV